MAKKRISKRQKELFALGVIVAAIIGVVLYEVLKPQQEQQVGAYRPPEVRTDFSQGIFSNPEYQKLSAPIQLPLEPGPHHRDNPFEAF